SAETLAGIRILILEDDSSRADVLAQELRARLAQVVVYSSKQCLDLERIRAVDPDIILVSADSMAGDGFGVVRDLQQHVHLSWVSGLVVPWKELQGFRLATPDIQKLAAQITKLREHDRKLSERALAETAFETRLELTGPSRALRAVCATKRTLHLTVRSPKA